MHPQRRSYFLVGVLFVAIGAAGITSAIRFDDVLHVLRLSQYMNVLFASLTKGWQDLLCNSLYLVGTALLAFGLMKLYSFFSWRDAPRRPPYMSRM